MLLLERAFMYIHARMHVRMCACKFHVSQANENKSYKTFHFRDFICHFCVQDTRGVSYVNSKQEVLFDTIAQGWPNLLNVRATYDNLQTFESRKT
jgi:hypothetical protein